MNVRMALFEDLYLQKNLSQHFLNLQNCFLTFRYKFNSNLKITNVMMRSNRLNDNQLEFKNSLIIPPILLGVIFAGVGGYMVYQGWPLDFTEWGDETVVATLGLLFGVGGVLGAIFGPRSHIYLFDKNKGTIAYRCKKLVGKKSDTFPMEGINRILITKRRKRSGSNKGNSNNSKKIEFSYLLEYESGDNFELGKVTKNHSRFALATKSPRPKAIQELREFLDVPIEELGFKEVFSEMKNTIKDLMAEKDDSRAKR